MTDNKHDFKGALKRYNLEIGFDVGDENTILFALRLAARLQSGEVSEGMINAADNSIENYKSVTVDDILRREFRAMTTQLMKEVEDDATND